MPWIIAILLQGLIGICGTIAGRVLVALGIGVVTYTGTSATLGWLKSQAIASLQSTEWVALLSHMKVGVAISIVFSAIVARALITGMTSDTVKRWVLK